MKFKLNKIIFPSNLEINKLSSGDPGSAEIEKIQKNVYMQAGLAILTVVLTVVILFAMTSAWYTNIAQTSGLVFDVEPWGFEGDIIVDENPVAAGPGDKGTIHLEATNDSDGIIDVSVSISKTGMSNEMKKRMFFYVDTPYLRNGETMNCVYINKIEGYTYTVFGKSSLMITEQVSNAPKLKWQWVYDVLGYYVLGGPGTEGTIVVDEYLRPIEYDYDKAVFTKTGENMYSLETIDGVKRPIEFLNEISLSDGYHGVIDENTVMTSDGYYPVELDENGYGVYAYLCSYSEIEMATKDDTYWGELAYRNANDEFSLSEEQKQLLKYGATINVSAQNNDTPAVTVNNANDLQKIINEGTYSVVQLGGSVTVETLEIPSNTKIMVDLNGNTITGTGSNVVDAKPGSSVTIINGTLGGPANGTAVNATGAEVNIGNINISGMKYGVYVGDSFNNNSLDSSVRIVGCKISTSSCALFASGNGSASAQKTVVVIENSELNSEGIVISGNGDVSGTGRWGTDISIIDSIVSGNPEYFSAGVYQPQKDSVLTVYNSQISGYTGIAVKGGFVNISGSTITGTGAVHNAPAFGGSGFSDTGDAVYVETNYGYDINIRITDNSVLTSVGAAEAQSIRVYDENADNVEIEIISGVFDEEQPDAYIAAGSVKNGNIVSVSYIAEE